MQLLLVRHADAENTITSDFARKLTGKGHKQAKQLAEYLAEKGITADRIIVSPLVRAKETADYLNDSLQPEIYVEDQTLACGMTPREACSLLRSFGEEESIILVGHEPDMSESAAYLCGMDDSYNISFKKAACAVFEIDNPGKGNGSLKAFINPKYI
ncbi:MAG: phosphohistidine phosphatase SixA [Planctomycetota bacterium]|jgi:phosphohistidine phosphatase